MTPVQAAIQQLASEHGLDINEVMRTVAGDPDLAAWVTAQSAAYRTFVPRPDRPEVFDQQASFVNARDTVSFFLAGNGSGKTEAAAAKCAKFLLRDQAPPRKNTPFWVMSDTMDIVTDVCWGEKLCGNGHIPASEIVWDEITWHNKKAGQPKIVPLRPWPGKGDRNWVLHFKSYEQGRQAMQARSIGGFWFSEQFPVSIFTETMVRCRDYLFPGGQFCEFTPLEPDLCIWLEKLMAEPPPGWKFYRGNTEMNRDNLAKNAIESFMATVPDELVETRLRGALASFEGAIFTNFAVNVHVVPDAHMESFPAGTEHAVGIDWGASESHPQTAVFGCVDGAGCWHIYDEYWSTDQSRTLFEHAQAIVDKADSWGWPIKRRHCAAIAREIPMITPSANIGMGFADPSRPGCLNDFTQFGVPCGPACNDVYDGINEIRRLLKIDDVTQLPRLRIAKRCTHLIEEMRKYRWMRAKSALDGGTLNPTAPKPMPLKRDDDTVDAMRYLIMTFGRFRGVKQPVSTVARTPPASQHTRTSGAKMLPGMFERPQRR